ncbi:MAG: hypothetical protein JJ863_22410 [Deltaproteobacteria bacterium]|nr:hypothetical protein [Deltaproteobacteria bacterium]
MAELESVITVLEERALRALDVEGEFIRSELIVSSKAVAIGSLLDRGDMVGGVVPHEDSTHPVYAARAACCLGVAGSTRIEVDPSSVSPRQGAVVAKFLARSIAVSTKREDDLAPDWSTLIRDRDDFAALALLPATWRFRSGRILDSQLTAVREPGTRTIAWAFYEGRLLRCVARYERLFELEAPAVILQNERQLITSNVEQLERRGYWTAVEATLPEATLATVRDVLARNE